MTRGAMGAAVVVVLVLAGAPFAGRVLVVSAPVDRPQAIVSLASHEWERLPATAALAAQFPDALVVLTLPESPNLHNCHDCANRAHRLALAGVAEARVRIVRLTAPGTHGEALATRALLQGSGLRRVLVVTSPYHTRRALATFRSVLASLGATVGVVPASATSPARPARWWTSPYDRAYVAYEWAALLFYAGRHGVWPWTGGALRAP
jgi:uncharacterized SAM-binding protein YcdF (DUF218 family)